jgi:four helix bundle protein
LGSGSKIASISPCPFDIIRSWHGSAPTILFVNFHKLTLESYPAHERFELGSQTRRATFSVTANIVEGCAREHRREMLQFLNTSRASLADVGCCLHVANRLGYLDRSQFEALEVSVRRTGAALGGFVRDGSAA